MVTLYPVDILHLDESLIVMNKPAGLPVLPDGWQPESDYAVKLMQAEFGRVWIVHRLDKVTSGLLLMARTAEAHRSLSMQFERHQALKVYHAISDAVPRWDAYTATQPLRANSGHKHRTVIDPRHGKPSTTEFRVMERYRAHALLEASPLTGRTHQIRAHAAAIGCPLVGDSLYGAKPTEIIARPALHALSVTFQHPATGLPVTYSAPYPEDFAVAVRNLQAAWP